jgi:hypothetical protein
VCGAKRGEIKLPSSGGFTTEAVRIKKLWKPERRR